MNLIAIAGLSCSITAFLLVIFSFLAGRKKLYFLIALFHMGVGFWGLGAFLAASAQSPTDALYGWKLGFTGGYFIAPIFFHLVISLSAKKGKIFVILGYLQAIVFSLLTWSGNMAGNLRQIFGVHYLEASSTMIFAIVIYSCLVIFSYVLLFSFIKNSTGLKNWQAKCVAVAFFFGFTGGSTTLLPIFHIDAIYPIGNFGVFISATILTYMVLREKVFDLERFAEDIHREKLAMIGTLTQSLNHEIKNSLYIIQGNARTFLEYDKAGIYEKDKNLEKARSIIQISGEQVTRIFEIIKRFAAFSRVKVSFELESINVKDLKNILATVYTLASHAIRQMGIKFIVSLPENLPVFKADPRYLEQVLFNLVMNACQILRKNGEIEISGKASEGEVLISVKDNGPGIKKEDMKKIFSPFYTNKVGGTGLGLFISQQLLQKNGAKINLHSELGKGAEFILEFQTSPAKQI